MQGGYGTRWLRSGYYGALSKDRETADDDHRDAHQQGSGPIPKEISDSLG